jgi:hypothetical protein
VGTVGHPAEEIERGLRRVHPGLRKTVTRKLAATVAAVLQTQTANTANTANTAARAAVLPIETERADMRLQWIARLPANPLLDGVRLVEPFARQRLNEAAANGQTVVPSMDRSDLGDRFAILMVSVGVGERALPSAWAVEAGAANLGFAARRALLESVRGWLPGGGTVLLAADRFYPSAPLFAWLQVHGWGYRLRLIRQPRAGRRLRGREHHRGFCPKSHATLRARRTPVRVRGRDHSRRAARGRASRAVDRCHGLRPERRGRAR